MPRSRKAASNARLAESVSTVEPDLDDTTSTVWVRPPASASPSSAASTWPGEVESRMTSGTPAVCAMTSGASDEPPMPASTTRVTPLATSCGAQGLDLGDERARDADRLDPAEPLGCLGLGGGPPQRRVAGRDAGRDEVGDEAGERLVDDRLDVSAQVDARKLIERSPARCAAPSSTVSLQLVPRGDELLDALVLEHLGDVGEVDADGGELVEHAVRVGVGAGDGVAGDLAVVERRLERLLGHRVHGAGGDELGDVQGVGQRRVLDAGRRPERPLHVGSGIRQRLGAVGGELLLEQLVGEARVRDAGLAT